MEGVMKKLVVLIGMLAVFTCGTSARATLINFDSAGQTLDVNTSVSNQYASLGVNFISGAIDYSMFTYLPQVGGANFNTTYSIVGGTIGDAVTNDSSTISSNYKKSGSVYYVSWFYTDNWLDALGSNSGFLNTTTTSGTNLNTLLQAGYATLPSHGVNSPTSNFLGFNDDKDGTGYSGTEMIFSSLLNSLSFQLNRPGTGAGSTNLTVALYNSTINKDKDTLVGYTYYNGGALNTSAGWLTFDSANITYANGIAPGTKFDVALLYGDKRFMLDNISYSSAVPIPPSVLLFGSGLSGLFFFRRKKIES